MAAATKSLTLAQRVSAFINSPTGPKTTHFWGGCRSSAAAVKLLRHYTELPRWHSCSAVMEMLCSSSLLPAGPVANWGFVLAVSSSCRSITNSIWRLGAF